MKYLLDTCALSELVKSVPDVQVLHWFELRKAHELFISAMTRGELKRGVTKLPESKRKSELTLWLQQLETGFEDRILAFDEKVAETWAQMTIKAETQGKSIAAFDSIIADTAKAYDRTLVTRNVRDFANVGIEALNPSGAPPN